MGAVKQVVSFAVKMVVTLALLAAVVALSYRAGERAVDTAPPAPVQASPTVVSAQEGTLVESTSTLVEAKWLSTRSWLNRRSGTVTGSFLPLGQRTVVDVGSVLYEIDGAPVLVIRGSTPAYRTIGPNIVGRDVAQFQQFLVDQGLLTGAVDGKWGSATSAAVRVWQDGAGRPRSATVDLGSIVFMDALPATIAPAPQLVVGAVIGDGSVAFDELAPTPRFDVVVQQGANDSIGGGLKVEVVVADTRLEFVTASSPTFDPEGGVTVGLDQVPQSECAEWCASLATGVVTQLPATVTRSGPMDGVIVPVGALRSGAGSELYVVSADGEKMPVVVRLQVGSSAIVDGIDAGTAIELPGSPPAGATD